MENSFEWTKDIGEIPEIKYPITKDYIPETLEWCKHHYVPPIDRYITCCDFGNNDGMNGACHWCLEMTPYQFEMCWDATSVDSYMRMNGWSKEKAINFIEDYKQCNFEKYKKYRDKEFNGYEI